MNHRIIHIVIAIVAWFSFLAMLLAIFFGAVNLDGLRVACMAVTALVGLVASGSAVNPTMLTAPPTLPHLTRDDSTKDRS